MLYKYHAVEGESLPSPKNLNDLAKEGWEVLQILPHKEKIYIYLRRPAHSVN